MKTLKKCPHCNKKVDKSNLVWVSDQSGITFGQVCAECKEFLRSIKECSYCGKKISRSDMIWINDSYGIPFKIVCKSCEDTVKKSISHWKFDSSYARGRLNSDY